MSAAYVVWDWNGTLLDDVAAALGALNRMLRERGLAETTREYYCANFSFPVKPLYSRLGMDPDAEWQRICDDFHRYLAEGEQGIRSDAVAALELLRRNGVGQSILSALRQDLLLRDTTKFGVAQYFDLIYGVDNLDGATKLSRGHELYSRLFAAPDGPGAGASMRWMIGDTLHDVEVARELGLEPILVAGGHQCLERLRTAGCRVAGSLVEAVEMVVK